jgi:hypothetical protein
VNQSDKKISLHAQLTGETAHKIEHILHNNTAYDAAKQIAGAFLGGRKVDDDLALFGFWVPGLVDGRLKGRADRIKLEIFTPVESIDFAALKKKQNLEITFHRDQVQLTAVGDYMAGVVENVKIGTKDQENRRLNDPGLVAAYPGNGLAYIGIGNLNDGIGLHMVGGCRTLRCRQDCLQDLTGYGILFKFADGPMCAHGFDGWICHVTISRLKNFKIIIFLLI